jgi:oxygen-dependent protoporphyrinogen oxidase
MENSGKPAQRVAVIGGGVTGLSAAFRLRELAPELGVQLIEASDRPGGVIQTEQQQGFTLELGPDSILRRLPWGVDLCRRLGIEDQLVGTEPAARGVYTVHRGRAVRMPEGLAIMAPERVWPMVTTPILSWSGKLRMVAERLVPRRTSESDESLAEFAQRRLGREAYERIVQPLAGGIFMGDPEKLSLRACFPQFAAMEAEHGSLIKATRLARRKRLANASAPTKSVFVAPRNGLGKIIEALVSKLGDRVHLRKRVVGLRRKADAWRLTIEDQASHQQNDETYDAVIVATPAQAAGRLLGPLDARFETLLSGIEYSSCAIVQLAYPMDKIGLPLDTAGLVVPHIERRPLQACSFSSVKYAGRAPDGSVLLRAFFGGALHPELVELSDERLVELAQTEVAQLLRAEGEPTLTRVQRWRQSMPQYALGHLERVYELEQLTARHPGLELSGAPYRGVGIPHCIHSAEQAAERLLACLNKIPAAL